MRRGRVRLAGVADRLEEEPRGRHGEPGHALVALDEEARDVALAHPARADLEEDPDDAPDHLPEEVRGGDPDEDEAVRLGRRGDAGRLDDDDGRVVPLRVLAEAREVVPAREEPRLGDRRSVPYKTFATTPPAGTQTGSISASR